MYQRVVDGLERAAACEAPLGGVAYLAYIGKHCGTAASAHRVRHVTVIQNPQEAWLVQRGVLRALAADRGLQAGDLYLRPLCVASMTPVQASAAESTLVALLWWTLLKVAVGGKFRAPDMRSLLPVLREVEQLAKELDAATAAAAPTAAASCSVRPSSTAATPAHTFAIAAPAFAAATTAYAPTAAALIYHRRPAHTARRQRDRHARHSCHAAGGCARRCRQQAELDAQVPPGRAQAPRGGCGCRRACPHAAVDGQRRGSATRRHV